MHDAVGPGGGSRTKLMSPINSQIIDVIESSHSKSNSISIVQSANGCKLGLCGHDFAVTSVK